MWHLFSLITIGALIDSVNPCAFSILVLTIAFLFALGGLRLNVLKVGILYIVGIFVVYFLIGVGILQTLNLFGMPNFMSKVGAAFLIIFGVLQISKDFFPKLPINFGMPKSSSVMMAKFIEKGSLAAGFSLGCLVGLVEFPCTGVTYLMVLGLLHDYFSRLNGIFYLLYYNLIFILPLIVILIFATNKKLLEKIQKWQTEKRKIVKWLLPLAAIILGIFVFLI